LGNVLNIFPPKGVEGFNDYVLRRYEKSPSTLLELTAPKVEGVSVQNLVFTEDNKLSIAIPASEGQEEAVMFISFQLNK
jgi:hypothetical protein